MWKVLGCAIALGIGMAPAGAAEVTIRFPVEYAIDIAPGLSNQDFKKLIEERTKGRVEVKLFPSGSLYKGLDLVQAILRGDAEMSTLTSAYWTALSPKVAVFELPYAFPERAAFYRAIDDAGFIDSLYDEVEAKGAKAITIMPYDHFGFGTRTKALRNPRDMAGLKMRGLGRTNSAMLQALGASAVSLNLVELSPALQQGVIDGLNAPIDIMLAYKWNESGEARHLCPGLYRLLPVDGERQVVERAGARPSQDHPGHRHRSGAAASGPLRGGDRARAGGPESLRRRYPRADGGRAQGLDRGHAAGLAAVRTAGRQGTDRARPQLQQVMPFRRRAASPTSIKGSPSC